MQTSMRPAPLVLSIVGLIAVIATVGFVMTLATEGRNGPLHHAISRSSLGYPPQRAVDALNAHDWDLAFREARRCVSMWEGEGSREQARLDADHAPIPSPFRTTNEEMAEIMRRGSVNSLAHCSLIEAEAARRLGDFAEALHAYQRTERLTYGRVYDVEAQWFWSPAERATEAIARLASRR